MTGDQIRVLGPIDIVTSTGRTIGGGLRRRALLGALVVSAGRAVPIDALVEIVWGDDPPRTATATLQSHVSHLRTVLGQDAIARVDHSYRLDVDANLIDAVCFERLLSEANAARDQPERCRELCGRGLRLWRGRPFGELADDPWFELEAYRLDQLRLAVMELSLTADLALGRHELIIGELENAVEEHPYHEGLWYLLIDALARSDRRVEALRVCARLRTTLGELGVDPGDRLVAREQAILAGAADMD